MHDSGIARRSILWITRKSFRRVYLCGGINGLSDSECNNWRSNAKSELIVPTVDPMARDYRGKEGSGYKLIVHGDVRDIWRSGVVLVNACRPSWGTAMEVVIAWLFGREVIAFVGTAPISPWLKYFADGICYSFWDACKRVNSRFQ